MMGTFAFPFAEAESVMLTLARDLDAQADAMTAPEGFQGRTARAFAGAQRERRVVLTRLTESAYEDPSARRAWIPRGRSGGCTSSRGVR